MVVSRHPAVEVASFTKATTGAGSQLSASLVTTRIFGLGTGKLHPVRANGRGSVAVGGVLSWTVMVLDTGESGLPHGSDAVHISVNI